MVKSETDLKRMTKNELKQWLTKHDQRLPPNEKLKKYYLDRAISYFKLLQQEQQSMNITTSNSNQSRSKIKHKGKVISNSRTKTKLKSSSSSLSSSKSRTPTSTKKKIVKTQRRHSTINKNDLSSSPNPSSSSLSRSKRKIIRVKRKTPTKQSPSLSKSIKKKRERVRRATADPANLAKEIEKEQEEQQKQESSESDQDDDDEYNNYNNSNRAESENDGDFNNYQYFEKERNNNLIKRKFSCLRDPEKMTIRDLQKWLDFNKINFQRNQKKSTYVNLVRKYSLPSTKAEKERFISPVRKNKNNNNNNNDDYNPPLPSNLRRSPLTPQEDDEKSNYRSRIHRKTQPQQHKKSGLLSTPALNKTGISRIDTPSKLAMRDEIRSLLGDTMDLNPMYPVKDSKIDSGITPGGPCEYDANVMNDVLSDLHKEQIEKDIDSKDNETTTSSLSSSKWMNAIINKISPHKPTSESIMKDKISSVLSINNKINYHDTSIIRKGKRTIPSPASNHETPQETPLMYKDVNIINNGNFRNDILIPPSPIDNYKQKININNNNNHDQDDDDYDDDDDDDDMPQTPAIPHCNNNNNNNGNVQEYNIVNPRRSPRLQKKNIFNNNNINNNNNNNKYNDNSPKIIPSIPQQSNISETMKNEKLLKEKHGATRCKSFGKFLFSLTIIIGLIACFFTMFDGMTKINIMLNEIEKYLNNIGGGKEEILFCDTDKETISGLDLDESLKCEQCPKQAAFCSKGRVECKTNFIFQDNKCVLNGIIVKFGFEIKNQVFRILSERRGKYECNEIDQDEGYQMSQDELIANIEIIDNRKKIEAFEYFKKHILPESQSISINQYGRYYSHKVIKSPSCKIYEWCFENILGIIATFIVIFIVFAIWSKYKGKQREKQEIIDLTNEIYRNLEEYAQFENKHIAVDIIKQTIKPKNDKIWKEAEKLISKDARIQKSMRMIDGIQRKCWRASITKISQQQQLHQQQQQQPQWNFNNNFVKQRSNSMQSNNFNDDDRAETQTRFPPHSKHRMW